MQIASYVQRDKSQLPTDPHFHRTPRSENSQHEAANYLGQKVQSYTDLRHF